MKVISVINYKGGVGKTTLTANAGAELAARGFNVLMIDMDAQASLTFSFIRPEEWTRTFAATETIKEWYWPDGQGTPKKLSDLRWTRTRFQSGGSLSLIPSHLELIDVDLELATQLAAGTMKQARRKFLDVHRRLAIGLQDPALSDVDVVLIDCPPNFNIVTKTAIVASEYVLIPAKPDSLSTMGIDYLRKSLDRLVSDYNDYAQAEIGGETFASIDPQIIGVVFTMVQKYAGEPVAAQRPYISQTKQLGLRVFKHWLRENKTVYGPAPANRKPVVLNTDAYSAQYVRELEGFVDELVRAAKL